MTSIAQALLKPERLWSRAEVLSTTSPVPAVAGVYAWYFVTTPGGIPTSECVKSGGNTLLYVGISPKAPPASGRAPSTQTLRSRLRYHYNGNAEGSTLRRALGCLLAESLGIELRRVGSGRRMTLGGGEDALSSWMSECALVTWMEHSEPWVIERELIENVNLPLNLDLNAGHPFARHLRELEAAARARARALPVLT